MSKHQENYTIPPAHAALTLQGSSRQIYGFSAFPLAAPISGAGICIFVCPPDDPDAFVTALDKMLADPVEMAAMGERARAYVEQWLTPERQAERYDELFRELVAARITGRPQTGRAELQ